MKTTLPQSLKPFILAMACYPLALAAAWILQIFVYPLPLLRSLVMFLPAVPVVFATIYFARGIGELDELQRRIQLEAMAFSLGGLVLIGMTVGMLTSVGTDLSFNIPFPLLNAFLGTWSDNPSWIWVSVLAVFLWGIGLFFAERRYR
jgi:hypothetical protein